MINRQQVLQQVVVVTLVMLLVGCGAPAATPEPPTATAPTNTPEPTDTPEATAVPKPQPQGFSPFAIAITKDGKYAYLSFDLSETIFKVRLEDMSIEAAADLNDYFPLESESIALDANEEKLFVSNPSWRKLLVLDTRTMDPIYVIDDIGIRGMIRSQYGPYLITWDGSNTVRFVNTDTYEITEFVEKSIGFLGIREGGQSGDEWYVLTQLPGEQWVWVVGIYNRQTKAWERQISFPLQAEHEGPFDLQVLPGGEKVYLATLGGWYPKGFHGYGWVHSIDLASKTVEAIPVDGGALSLEISPDGQRLYVATGWPIPKTNNLLVIDAQSDKIVGQIQLGQNTYGWHYTQMNDLQIDPANPRWLYATSTDGNAFIKVDLESNTPGAVRVLNNESLRPHFFARNPAQPTGYILIHGSPTTFALDLNTGSILNVAQFPMIRDDVYVYDVAFLDPGRLLIAQGESLLEADAKDMRLLEQHPLPPDIPGVWRFVLSNDRTKLYTVSQQRGTEDYGPDQFVVVNTANFQVEASFKLEGGAFNNQPFELPDGSKLYAVGGETAGPVVIHVMEADNYTIQKTITFDEPGLLGISGGPYYPFAYDTGSHILFVGATEVVLAINTDTDVVERVIRLADVARTLGLEPLSGLTYQNAIGLFYNPGENYLYIAHLDRSFISIYDLSSDRFLPQVIPLKGYFPNFMFANDDGSKLYTLNTRSDSVSVIDVNSKTVEKVIDLHTYHP